MNSKGFKIGATGIAFLAVLVIAGIYLYIYPETLAGLGVQPAAIPMPEREVIVGCASTTTPELKFVVLDKINQGTLRTADFDVNIYLNGTYNRGYHLSDDSTADVSPGDGYALYATESGANTTYFGHIITGNVPCEELKTVNFMAATVGSLTATFYNDDDGLANSDSDEQTVGAGETVNIDFALKETTADACLGTEHSTKDLLACWDYNSTAFKKPIMKMDGATAPTANVPEGHSGLRDSYADSTVCYVLQGIKEICDYDKAEGLSLQLEAKSGQNPGSEYNSDLNLRLYLPQVFQDAETGVFDYYYADQYNATQIITPKTGRIYIE